MRSRTVLLLPLVCIPVAAGCGESGMEPVTPLLARYVALGNSITAGFQSAGISDAVQRTAYPALLARQAGASYSYASMGAGCPAPITSLLSAIADGGTRPCTVTGTPGRKILTNVAVPGADSFDPTDETPDTDDLTSLILDGHNQVEKALEQVPSFVSIWIGGNDVLGAAMEGIVTTSTITPVATFEGNYAAMMSALTAGGAEAGILIGVVDVTGIPLLVPASALDNSVIRAALNQAVGETVTIDGSCTGSTVHVSLAIIAAMVDDTHEPRIACTTIVVGGLGDRYILDAGERASIRNAVDAYNAVIEAAAADAGWAYWDPNPLLEEARDAGQIPSVPNVFSLSAPFGPLFSLDGVHPSPAAHRRIANALIDAINDAYETSIRHIP